MRNFSKVSLGALFIVLNASPAFAELASKSYVERKATVSDAAAADVGKIAIYAADGSGQKIAASIGAAGSILRSDGTSAFWDDDKDHITTASTSGIGNAVTAITADGDGALSVVKGAIFLTSADLPAPYTLPAATSAILGGVKLGSDTVQTVVANAVATATGRTYAIQTNAAGQLVVNVGVDANTIYTGTAPIAVSGTVISHNNSDVTPNTYGPGANATLTHGGTFTVPSVTVDAKGHLTAAATRTFTMPLDDSVATGTTTGTSNAYALAATGFVLTRGSHVVAKINVANSTTSTLNVNGTGAKTIQFEGAVLTAGMLKVNTDYTFVYDGTNWQMLSDNDHITTSSTTGGGNAVTAITADANGALSVTKGQTFLTSADLPAAYVLPAATNTALGGLKLAQAADAAAATLATDTTTSTRNYRVKLDSGNIAYVNIPWLDHITTASTSGAGNAVTAITADANGALSITKGEHFLTSFTETDPSIDTTVMGTAFTTPGTTGTAGKVYRVQKDAAGKAVVSVPWATYSAATSTALGLAKLASDTAQSIAANAVTATAGKTYGIQNNAAGQLVVNVPWTDTNNRAFNGASTAGTAAAYTLAATRPAFTASDLTAGSIVIATINVANSANPTLSVGGQTERPIFMTNTDLAATAGALRAGTIYSFTFDGSNWYAKEMVDTNTAANLSTTSTTALSTSASESLLSGTVNLHKVAKTGTYSDLIGTPTIPTVNDAALTVTQNGVSLGSNYTANTATARTYSIVAPDWAAAVGAKDEIKNKPTLAISTAETAAGVGGLDGFIPRIPFACTQSNVSCSLNYGKFSYDSGTTGTGHGISTGTNLGFFWELIVR